MGHTHQGLFIMDNKKGYIALIVAGGTGTRSGYTTPKQYLPLLGQTVLGHSAQLFAHDPRCSAIYIAINAEHRQQCERAITAITAKPIILLETAGDNRQATVRTSLAHLAHDAPFGDGDSILVHDAARPCLSAATIDTLMVERDSGHEAVVPALPIADTLRRIDSQTGAATDIDRTGIHAIQTPQAFDAALLHDLHQRYSGEQFTDDAALFARAGMNPFYVAGDRDNIKITYAHDLENAAAILSHRRGDIRTATGYDVHEYTAATKDRPMRLGGITLDHDKALKGHSDADAVLHAITDALLGCIAAQDIGHHFSPKDARWKDADSTQFLAHARDLITARGGIICHIDTTVICEEPKIGPHRNAMQAAIADILHLPLDRVSIKATTSEGLGFTGRREGLAAQACATIRLPFTQPLMKDTNNAA